LTSHREMAERHVREGLRLIAWQRDLIARRKAGGLSTRRSEELLATFEISQAIFEDDLAALIRKGHG
jgi:hypothetical protein